MSSDEETNYSEDDNDEYYTEIDDNLYEEEIENISPNPPFKVSYSYNKPQ